MTASSSVFFSSCVPSVFSEAWLPSMLPAVFSFSSAGFMASSSSCVNFEPQYSHLYAPEAGSKISSPSQFGHLKLITDMHCSFLHYGLCFPQLLQNFPVFTAPHSQVQSAAGAGFPQLVQNFPVFTAPHSQVQSDFTAGAGAGFPQLQQNFPVFVVPHSQVHSLPAGAAACCAGAAC